MTLDRRRLQRQNQLRQSVPPETLLEHRHSYWRQQDYVFVAGQATTFDDVAYVDLGQRILLDPIVLMFAVKAELLLTSSFTGSPETYTLKVSLGGTDVETVFSTNVAHALTTIDFSSHFASFFKLFTPMEAGCAVKVSNALRGVRIHGITLRFTLWERDSFGDYEKPTNRLLTNAHVTQKAFIQKLDDAQEAYTYLSGIKL